MRILFLPGIDTQKWKLAFWRKDLSKAFPKAEIVFLDDIFYFYFQHDRIQKIVEQGIRIVQDKIPTIILAHSFGGIIAKAIIASSPEANIQKLVTMASPHRLNYLGIKEAKKAIHSPLSVPVPTETYGGYFDVLVPFPLSYIKKKHHTDLPVEHIAFLFSGSVRKQVIQSIQ
jgi:pimeloyl-ACP methyl ester carboxylesterase